MKKGLYILLTLSLCAGCVRDLDEYEPSRRITFVTANYSVDETKAEFTDDEFHVSAWTSSGYLYFGDVAVSKSGAVWTTPDGYWWPKSDQLRFVATHGRVSGKPWAAVNASCTTLATNGSLTVSPVKTSNLESQYLFTDRTAAYDWQTASVPLTFRNAMAAVCSYLRIRRFDDVILKEDPSSPEGLDNPYRRYDIYTDTTSAGYKDHTVYYVVPFGYSANGRSLDGKYPYPSEVRLKTPISHIWAFNAMTFRFLNVADAGSLSMTLESEKWKEPSNGVWTVASTLAAHGATVTLYSATDAGEAAGTPMPGNLFDYKAAIADEYRVIPQDLNWSPLSTINNQKAEVLITANVYHADVNKDGIFDYRDVYQYETVNGHKITSATLAETYGSEKFKQWVEWDGTGSSMLKRIHDEYEAKGINVTFAKVMDGLRPHFYDLKSTIPLSKLPGAQLYWGMNTRTSYTVIIDPVTDEFTWSPSVAEWEDLGKYEAKEVK